MLFNGTRLVGWLGLVGSGWRNMGSPNRIGGSLRLCAWRLDLVDNFAQGNMGDRIQHQATALGWRPLLLSWRPLLVGWRPFT